VNPPGIRERDVRWPRPEFEDAVNPGRACLDPSETGRIYDDVTGKPLAEDNCCVPDEVVPLARY